MEDQEQSCKRNDEYREYLSNISILQLASHTELGLKATKDKMENPDNEMAAFKSCFLFLLNRNDCEFD